MNLTECLEHIHKNVRCAHHRHEIREAILEILEGPPGVVVELGAYLGGSSAKLSWACDATDRELHVFDSFRGLPTSEDIHRAGQWAASYGDWVRNMSEYGALHRTQVHVGWFRDTIARLQDKDVAVAYTDFDVSQSAREAIPMVWERLVPGGVIVSQDGKYEAMIDAMTDVCGVEPERMGTIVKFRKT